VNEDSNSGKLDFLAKEALQEKNNNNLEALQMHRTSSRFWKCFDKLPYSIQKITDDNFELLKDNPYHP